MIIRPCADIGNQRELLVRGTAMIDVRTYTRLVAMYSARLWPLPVFTPPQPQPYASTYLYCKYPLVYWFKQLESVSGPMNRCFCHYYCHQNSKSKTHFLVEGYFIRFHFFLWSIHALQFYKKMYVHIFQKPFKTVAKEYCYLPGQHMFEKKCRQTATPCFCLGRKE